MSIMLMSAVWQHGPNDRSQRLLMLALADCANDQGVCWPGTQTLAGKACMNVRTVLRTLKDLEFGKWLTVAKRSHEHRGNTYQLLLERLLPHDTVTRDTESHDKLSRDKTSTLEVTKRTKRGDKTDNPPHPPIGRTIKNHQEPSGEFVLTAQSTRRSFDEAMDVLIHDGWRYYLERLNRRPEQYKLTAKRRKMAVGGFQSLLDFAETNEHPDPLAAAAKLFRAAVDHLATSAFHNGKNDRHKKYLDWRLLFEGDGYEENTRLLEFWLDDDRWAA